MKVKRRTVNANNWGENVIDVTTGRVYRFIGLGQGCIHLDDDGEDLLVPKESNDFILAETREPLFEEWEDTANCYDLEEVQNEENGSQIVVACG